MVFEQSVESRVRQYRISLFFLFLFFTIFFLFFPVLTACGPGSPPGYSSSPPTSYYYSQFIMCVVHNTGSTIESSESCMGIYVNMAASSIHLHNTWNRTHCHVKGYSISTACIYNSTGCKGNDSSWIRGKYVSEGKCTNVLLHMYIHN